jgi:AraC-like DNA-binding protein
MADERAPGANASLHQYLEKLANQIDKGAGDTSEAVRRIIRMQLIGGSPSVDRAASVLGIHRRTLARRLSNQEKTYRELVQDVRLELAEDLLKKTDAPISKRGSARLLRFKRVFARIHEAAWTTPV